jgi:membrane protein DedA with SNARE-associated domain
VLASLADLLTNLVARHGYLAVFVLMLLSSACVPIPSEVAMAFAGALATGPFAAAILGDPSARLDATTVVATGVAGSVIGSWLAWMVGYAGGRPLVDRFGRYLLLRPHEVDRAHGWFERHGEAAVFFARLIPLVRSFISLPAGVARMPFGRFTLYTFLGIVPWTAGLALAGYELGRRWEAVDRLMAPISAVVGVTALLAIGWWVRRRLKSRRSEGRTTQSESERR